MGRGGGGSSGGRSFSSGSGRSFGGRSSSSHRGGSSPGRGGGSSSGSFRGRSGGYRPSSTHVWHHHSGYVGGTRHVSGGYRPGGAGAFGLLFAVIAVIFFLAVVGLILSGDGVKINGAGRSTVERAALEPYRPFDKDCVDDRAEWIGDRNVLLKGMEAFYKKTGVQPALCITSDLDGEQEPTAEQAEAYAARKYDELVGHEQGVLLLFFEPYPSDWDAWYMAGEAAQTVMDTEACDILMDYVEAYYTSDMSEDEYFGAVFRETGERVMSVTPTFASHLPWIAGGCVAVAVVIGGVMALKAKYRRDKEKAEETERILKTPVDRL